MEERSKKQKQKNVALLLALLGLIALVFAVSFVRMPLPHLGIKQLT